LPERYRTFHRDRVLIYKILLPAEWAEFEAAGRFEGSPVDRRDGFIHCSSRIQVGGTARRFFSQEPALVILAVDADMLGHSVRWEAASDGKGVFPHVYGVLPRDAVAAVHHVSDASSVDETLPPD
jgi:uncharacterized protein (DUF952 family)